MADGTHYEIGEHVTDKTKLTECPFCKGSDFWDNIDSNGAAGCDAGHHRLHRRKGYVRNAVV